MSLSDLPTTNLRIVVSLTLAVCYVIGIFVLYARNIVISTEMAFTLGTFILAMLGIDLAQFTIKRKTYKPGETDQEPQQ